MVVTVVQILSSFDQSLDHTSIQEMHSIEICKHTRSKNSGGEDTISGCIQFI
jgi:hypothetical protein